MQRTPALFLAATRCARFHTSRRLYSDPPIVKINNGTFYRQHPSSKLNHGNSNANPPLFPGLTISLPSSSTPNQRWAILSPSSDIRTAFLQILRGQFLCFPPTARSFPYLLGPAITEDKPHLRFPERAIEYVGFDVERKAFGGAYLSARYESLKEETDFTVQRYLTGIVTMNPGEEELKAKSIRKEDMERVMQDLELERFIEKPVSMLSNGQSRRARIAKALLSGPEMLCLDAPFIGLDPIVTKHISGVLHRLAEANAPRIVLSLRPQDDIPEWVTHLVYAGEDGVVGRLGTKEEVLRYLNEEYKSSQQSGTAKIQKSNTKEVQEVGRLLSEKDPKAATEPLPVLSRDGYKKTDKSTPSPGEPLVEMNGVRISYGANSILGDWHQPTTTSSTPGLHWTVNRGSRWGIFGANGSGKTTLLSLVTSDHPQTYSAPVKLFQRSRLPSPGTPGISIFEIQARMGHASPEVHALFPKRLSVREALESAWSETPISRPRFDDGAERKAEAALKWFEREIRPSFQGQKERDGGLEWAKQTLFGEISFSAQRVILFLRATIRNPDIVILDEAFSGMDDAVRDKCLLFLSWGEGREVDEGGRAVETGRGDGVVKGLQEHQALLCVSHSKMEVPGCVREWVCLPEPGTGPPRFGRFDGPIELDERRWKEVWGEV
ncbi:hypothetical protein GGP41_001279 [Bipolaris sorokiniana]|uniref:ABC transporter domain-containing protein n=2 Tax=Cochliobolus sativus TaxID=45130 RepID=A0A8H5ZBK3_COCSA|nr:uncharacterized protein COCSADRAFT_21767 [Bipolaris sorokiniana ND90Pr]EMD69571.1 hypothetical protein COCSADRAFT_21767 [Bipolaris sorokiniana ND90Pr]KAF5845224.1 hypothetical protein GGP41_001279 [Bipolaris sorokiniana]